MSKFENQLSSLIPRKLIYCDVGARWGIEQPWKQFQNAIEQVCFEPDREEYKSLKRNCRNSDKIYQYALLDEPKDSFLNLTRSRGCSSTYKPNQAFLNNYPEARRFHIEKTVPVKASSLDFLYDTREIKEMDFIKIDVQGAELDILKGGKKLLSENILGIQVEVEFHPIYEDQPLFADVDQYIRDSIGLQIQDLRKAYWKYKEGINVGSSKGQLVFGDALYLRSPEEIISWCERYDEKEAMSKIISACLIGIIYGCLDYSIFLLALSQKKGILSQGTIEQWKSIILEYGKSLKYNGKGSSRLAKFFGFMHRLCQSRSNDWAYSGHHLGVRKKYGIFY
jgi:FkbM family methyltransferase